MSLIRTMTNRIGINRSTHYDSGHVICKLIEERDAYKILLESYIEKYFNLKYGKWPVPEGCEE